MAFPSVLPLLSVAAVAVVVFSATVASFVAEASTSGAGGATFAEAPSLIHPDLVVDPAIVDLDLCSAVVVEVIIPMPVGAAAAIAQDF